MKLVGLAGCGQLSNGSPTRVNANNYRRLYTSCDNNEKSDEKNWQCRNGGEGRIGDDKKKTRTPGKGKKEGDTKGKTSVQIKCNLRSKHTKGGRSSVVFEKKGDRGKKKKRNAEEE